MFQELIKNHGAIYIYVFYVSNNLNIHR